MSQHLHMVVQEKEQTISDLFSKLKEYDKCLDEAEATFKHKLQERSQVVLSFILLIVCWDQGG